MLVSSFFSCQLVSFCFLKKLGFLGVIFSNHSFNRLEAPSVVQRSCRVPWFNLFWFWHRWCTSSVAFSSAIHVCSSRFSCKVVSYCFRTTLNFSIASSRASASTDKDLGTPQGYATMLPTTLIQATVICPPLVSEFGSFYFCCLLCVFCILRPRCFSLCSQDLRWSLCYIPSGIRCLIIWTYQQGTQRSCQVLLVKYVDSIYFFSHTSVQLRCYHCFLHKFDFE